MSKENGHQPDLEQFKNLSAEEISGKPIDIWIKDMTLGKTTGERVLSKEQAILVAEDQMKNARGWLVGNRKLREKVPLT